MSLRQVRQVRQVGSGTYSFAAIAPPPPLNIDSLSEGAFVEQMSCPVEVLAAVAAPAAPTSRVSDPRHASSNDMVSQENCGHGINGARSANTCAALMKHRARCVALGGS